MEAAEEVSILSSLCINSGLFEKDENASNRTGQGYPDFKNRISDLD